MHDLRRSFVTLAQVDGASPTVLEAISHGPRGDIAMYTSLPWPSLCAEISKMKFELPRPPAEPLRLVAGDPKRTVERTPKKKGSEPVMIPSPYKATPTGFEDQKLDL